MERATPRTRRDKMQNVHPYIQRFLHFSDFIEGGLKKGLIVLFVLLIFAQALLHFSDGHIPWSEVGRLEGNELIDR